MFLQYPLCRCVFPNVTDTHYHTAAFPKGGSILSRCVLLRLSSQLLSITPQVRVADCKMSHGGVSKHPSPPPHDRISKTLIWSKYLKRWSVQHRYLCQSLCCLWEFLLGPWLVVLTSLNTNIKSKVTSVHPNTSISPVGQLLRGK